MVRKCYIPDCLSEEGKEEHQGVTFHKIPMHPDIRPKWLSLCHIPEDKKSMKVIHVCSRHFLSADFCHYKGKKYMLRQGALPSVFPWKKTVLKKVNSHQSSDSQKSVDDNEQNTSKSIKMKRNQSDVTSTSEMQESNSFCLPDSSDSSSTPNIDKIKAFSPNMHIEALDFNEVWYPAQIVEIDYEESEVLIHFEKYSSKYDEWISMNSSRLRPLQKKEIEQFSIGEKCLASWSDARKFPATVTKVLTNGTYEVLFDDGFVKTLKVHRMVKVNGNQCLQSSPLFDPIQSTKQERRDRKRKLNVAELFGKRSKLSDNVEERLNIIQSEDIESWTPKWENGKPVGTESMLDGSRKSFIVSDPRLPPHWEKHLTQRISGNSAGKWDTIIISPQGKRFRTRPDIKNYIEMHPELNLSESMFDFTINRKNRKAGSNSTVSNLPEIGDCNLVRKNKKSNSHSAEVINNETSTESCSELASKILKIESVDGVFRCPIEGCGKSFRRENLAQMHVKHYHPEYTKFLDSTPNVADLAYARTVGENLDKVPEKLEKFKNLSTKSQSQKINSLKASTSITNIEHESKSVIPEKDTITRSDEIKVEKLKEDTIERDSEIIKLLNTKPSVGSVAIKYPPGLPPHAYPDIKLKDLLRESNEDDMKLISTPSKGQGIKTLLPTVKNELKMINEDDTNKYTNIEVKSTQDTVLDTSLPFDASQTEKDSNYIVEGGEVIKIVQMKREEIINCTCGITEEDGLMIQCELCLCWQHAYCNNIQRENQVPDKYICYICQNPKKGRSTRTYYHDQDWLKHGTLVVGPYHCKDDEMLLKRFEKLKKSHDYSGALIELKAYIHALRVKLKIAEAKNHPKLYLWSKPWKKNVQLEDVEIKKESNTNFQKNELDGSVCIDKKDDSSFDLYSRCSTLLSFLKLDKNKTDDSLKSVSSATVPLPEAAIDSGDCRLHLLDHINHSQNVVESRLDFLEQKAEILEKEFMNDDNEKNPVHVSGTFNLLLNDLEVLQEFAQNSSY